MLIRAKVNAGARRERLHEVAKGVAPSGSQFGRVVHREFIVHVKEKPERNAANDRVRAILARHFLVPLSQVKIISGHQKPSKVIRVIK